MKYRPLLKNFRVRLPAYQATQDWAFDWLAQAHARAEATLSGNEAAYDEWQPRMAKLVRRFGCSPNHIGARHSELEDFLHTEWSRMQVFNLHESADGQALSMRNAFFSDQAERAATDFFAEDEDAPADLIHVSCTGYASPSPIQKLVDRKGWHHQTRTTQVYHMGCYAAVPALRVAAGLLAQPQGDVPLRAEIVHTELCTLHFNPRDHRPEQLVVQSLFADGHIRYAMTYGEADTAKRDEGAFEILAVREEVVPDSLGDMTWVLSEWGFRMTLAREVPEKIANGLPSFLQRLFADGNRNFEAEREKAVFAIHPGGPRIIDSVKDLLRLDESQITHSRAVLFDRGNMSSATLPHVWERIDKDETIKSGTLIVSLAFGPGLTMAGTLFEKC
jgi:predicted naringenin-chalcone synthase